MKIILMFKLERHIKFFVCTVLFITLMFSGYLYFFVHDKPSVADDLKLVETITLQKTDIQQSIKLIGTIRSQHLTTLIAKGTGVFDALAIPGQLVHKGDLIAKINNPHLEKNLQYSESIEKIAKIQFDRFDSFIKTGYVSAKEVEEKKQAWIETQKEIGRLNSDLDNLRFFAPFDGVVGVFKKREGMQVNAGEQVVSIYDPATLMVDIDIPCTNLPALKVGQEVHVLKKTYLLSHLQNMIDDETHMCPADISIACKKCLIGSNVDVDLVVRERKQTLVVPLEAIFLRNGNSFVYVVKKGKTALVEVKTGLRNKAQVEVVSGLHAGQQLIIKGQERLYPDMPVKIFKQPVQDA